MSHTQAPDGVESTRAPERAPLVLGTLILVSGVANLNLSVANVALPSIGDAFDSSQTTLNLIAVGYSLGLAASVLYLGAVGDRHGRKPLMMLGTLLSVPACLLAAYAWTDDVLVVARIFGGLAAGMAYPTTLALITALWSGPGRTKSIALWSALGGAIASLGPLVAGWLLEHFWWGSVFLVTLPLGGHRARDGLDVRPRARQRVDGAGRQPRRHPLGPAGGRPGALDQLRARAGQGHPRPGPGRRSRSRPRRPSCGSSVVPRTRSTTSRSRGRRIFWVAACAGIIVFGSLMGAMFVSQQFLQNVLGYNTVEAGAAFLPTILLMVIVAPRSAVLVETHGARTTLLLGYVFLLLAFLWMLLLWEEDSSYWRIGLAYAFIGIGVGLAGTPASHSLTGSVPVRRAGMASGTADLQRDLGGAIMQSVFGALLTAGYASAFASAIGSSSEAAQVSPEVESELTKSFAGAEQVAAAVPQVRRPDHRRGEVVLPAGRRLGLQRGRGRDPAGRRTRLPVLPAQGSRAAAVAGLRGTGRTRRSRPPERPPSSLTRS